MENSDLVESGNEPDPNDGETARKIKRTLDSMIQQMKITEDELKYRTDNFDDVDIEKNYLKYLKCTKCGISFQSIISKGKTVTMHPLLSVLMCNNCCDYYGDGNFSLDSDGEDKYCRWCGEGGTIFACSKCICGFCDKCVKNHFGEDGLAKVVNDDDWVCYFCDSKPLWELRSVCFFAKQAAEARSEQIKKKKLENKKKRNERVVGSDKDLSSEEDSSSMNATGSRMRRRKKLRRLRDRKSSENVKCESTSSNDEEYLLRRRKCKQNRKSLREQKKRKEDLTESEKENPKKRQKVESSEESPSFCEKKSLVLEKLRGIWKLTQTVAEVGLTTSRERLKRLSQAKSFHTMESLHKEFQNLESLMSVMSSSLNTARNSIDAATKDLTFNNLEDETEIYQNEETKMKRIRIKLKEETKRCSIGTSAESHFSADGSPSVESKEERDSVGVEMLKSTTIGRKASCTGRNSSDSDAENDCKANETTVEEVEKREASKPVLKVKSFARMLNDNVYDNNGEEVVEIEVRDESNSKNEKKQSHTDEYNAETDLDKIVDEEISPKKTKKRKKQPKESSGSNFSDEPSDNVRAAAMKVKKERDKMQATFERFRQEREKFFKAKENENSSKKTEKKSGKQRKLIIESSDEEEEEEEEEKKKLAEEEKIKFGEDKDENQSGKNSQSENEVKNNETEESGDSAKISSVENSSDEISSQKKKKKNLDRKKKKKDASSSEYSESEENEKKKGGRRNIKKILKKDSLHVETKEALKNEEDRKKRVEKKQRALKEAFPDDKEDVGEAKRLILDFDPETKEPLVTVHKKLAKKLKPHQREGVKFMWDNCFESLKRLEEDSGSGCILAHCMGLGKTLQVVTLVHTVMTHDLGVNCVLVVCPLSTVSNWINEFEMWLSNVHTEPITLYDLGKYRKLDERCFHLKDWHENGGVLFISYDLFRKLTTGLIKKKARKSKALKTFEEVFFDPGPDLVICDEGHLLKKEDTALSKCMNMVKTSRRIVLTGTPLQNNLMEYHCMVQFVKPNILGTKKEFSNRFVNPITNGQFEDSTDLDVKIMKRRSHVLHSMLEGCVQRFDYSVLTPFLPEKHEYVLSIVLTENQAKAYRHFINNLSGKVSGTSKAATLFNDYHNLQRIWTHPKVLVTHSEKEALKEDFDESEGSLKDFVVDTDEESGSATSSSCSVVEEVVSRKRILRSNANDPEAIPVEEEEEEKASKRHWWNDFFDEDNYNDLRASNKLVILFSLLKHCGQVKDKVLVFSQSLYSLDLIEHFLNKIDDGCDKDEDDSLCRHKDSWILGSDYFRLDGTTSSETRAMWCKHFNKESNTRARLFLISTRAGGLGINLFGANRVVIFDASWNPSYDLQSIFRVYRFGQKKTCYIYRFLAEATMEEKIYERQVTKLSLAHRVVDEHQIERHYSMMNLQELYNYDPTPLEKRKVPNLPKDSILAELLSAHKDAIVSYHEHDSLLENREEEELSEEERKAAWKEYENEKAQRAEHFDVAAFQQQMQMGIAQSQGMMPPTFQILDNSPLRMINPAFLALNPNAASQSSQSFVNPLASQLSIPLNVLQRGIQLGITPLFNESTESYLNRIKACVDGKIKVGESSPCYEMVRRFVRSKEFETPFALKLLSSALNEVLDSPAGEEDTTKNALQPKPKCPGNDEVYRSSKPSDIAAVKDVERVRHDSVIEKGKEQLLYEKSDSDVSNGSRKTELYDFRNDGKTGSEDDKKSCDGSEIRSGKEEAELIEKNLKDSEMSKRKFFSSDSDVSLSSSSSRNSSEIRRIRSVSMAGSCDNDNRKRNHEMLKESDSENRDLEKILRMTALNGRRLDKESRSSSEEEKDAGKVKKTKKCKIRKESETVNLMDCLTLDETLENESNTESKNTECLKEGGDANDFVTLINSHIKNYFLLSTEESGNSESEVENKKNFGGKKSDFKEEKIREKETIFKGEEKKKKWEDDLRDFKISDSSSEEELKKEKKKKKKKKRTSRIERDSSASIVSTVQETSESSLESSWNEDKSEVEEGSSEKESTVTESSYSSSDIQQVYVKTKQASPVKGRKNINKILKKEFLQVETKQALKMETERKRRLSERKKAFDKFFPITGNACRLVLDFDPETKEELVVVDCELAKKLKPHQREGVKFMWDNCFESLKRLEEDSGSGCILAHCMGLGKTLQVVTLVHTVMTHSTGVRSVVVMCPLNTVKNWIYEFRIWLRNCEKRLQLFDLTTCKSRTMRIGRVLAWVKSGGVMILSYEMFRSLIKKKEAYFGKGFLDPGPDLVVCDEGHVLKNESSNLSKFISQVKTLRRIVLTGTPLQNNLIEYYCMVQFVKPNILGTRKEFMNRFVNPINNGQFEDSTQIDVKIMKRRAHVLHTMLDGFIQRFSYHVLTPFLPEKQEYVISISLTETQTNIYQFFLESCTKENRGLFTDFHWMQKVWTHPRVMLKHSENPAKRVTEAKSKPVKWNDRPEIMRAHLGRLVNEAEYENLRSSGKLVLLFHILKRCKGVGDKLLVFSQSLDSLNLIEYFLKKAHEKHQTPNESYEFADSWVFGTDYLRMDGSTSSGQRDQYCRKFNNVKDKRLRLFLISTRAGGLGINLVAANRVVVFDASWNPSHDVQCIFRVYRFGQNKPCYIYRFLASATMEEKIYKRQVTKLSLAHRILDEHQIERHYSMGNLQELYRFEPIPKIDWKIPKLPKDSLFAEILTCNRDIIVGYHEHDSLLENKEEEELTEEERRVAWEEYEKEKTAPSRLEYGELINGTSEPSFVDDFNIKVLHVVSRGSKGPAPPAGHPQQLASNESQSQLCKIIDVRTLNGQSVIINDESRGTIQKSLEIGQSLGLKPFEGEGIDKYCLRVDQTLQKIFPWSTPEITIEGNLTNGSGN